jgi:hypothetical protein
LRKRHTLRQNLDSYRCKEFLGRSTTLEVSMFNLKERLDFGTTVVITITFVFFVLSLFVKGFGHDALLDVAIFLVSVKLMLMSSRNNLNIKELNQRLDEIKKLIT